MDDNSTGVVAPSKEKYHGSHGTTQRSAAGAKLRGFNLSMGRVGRGAYFWAKSPLFDHLAEGWFQQQLAWNQYREHRPQRAVIYADIECFEMEHIDLEGADFKSELISFALDRKLPISTDDEVAKLHTLFIEEWKRVTGVEIKVIEVRLAPPDSAFVPKYSIKAFGGPICYVVRDAKCITIEKIV